MRRKTRQRVAICEILRGADRPLSPAEVRTRAAAKVPGVGIATVYRALRALLEEGWLTRVEIRGGSTLYERADLRHHHHFQCDACGMCYDVFACTRDIERLVPPGFVLRGHDLLLHGLCEECASRR
ncbi:transcriptional repressor [Candidatus Sumerlaeota bacterium]|nr:transcriptional repressor [Candidatus Sumerlaeota bacterium]